jgi:SAM-dependent methyltransferase
MTSGADWIQTECVLCGQGDAEHLLEIPPGHGLPPSAIVRCTRCGLRRLNPRPGPAVLAAFYGTDYNAFAGRRRSLTKQRLWDRLRDAYARPSGHEPPAAVAWLLAPFARWVFDINVPLRRRGGVRVIDVGCGFGDLLIYLKSRGCDTLGVDLDARAAEQAAQYGVDIRVGSLPDLELPASSFDVAVMSHSLEHVPDPSTDLRELARILKPGGQLHIAVPNGGSAGLEVEGLDWAHLSHPLHVWFFDAVTLGALVERHGFRIVARPYATSRWHHWSKWAAQLTTSPVAATARAWRLALASLALAQPGDVLRLVAERTAEP